MKRIILLCAVILLVGACAGSGAGTSQPTGSTSSTSSALSETSTSSPSIPSTVTTPVASSTSTTLGPVFSEPLEWDRTHDIGGLGGGMVTEVVQVAEGLVAAGAGGEESWAPIVLRSQDGLAWRADSHRFGEAALADIAVTEWGLVVVGHVVRSGTLRAAVWASDGGQNWTRVSDGPEFDNPTEGSLSEAVAVAVRGAQVVVGGQAPGPTLWVTEDGTSWERIELAERGRVADVGVFGDSWIAVGITQISDESHGSVWTSDDGVHWVETTGLTGDMESQWPLEIGVSNQAIVILTAHSVLSSTDAATWGVGTLMETVEWVQGVEDLYVYDNVFYLVGFGQADGDSSSGSVNSKGVVWASMDGQHWEQVSDDNVFFPSGPQGWLVTVNGTEGQITLLAFGPDVDYTAIFSAPLP